MQTRFISAEIDVIIHATEDYDKILTIIKDILKIDIEKFTSNKLEGYYGNEVILLKARLNAEDARKLADIIFNSINIHDKIHLADNLDKHIDRNSLFIRLNKQELFKNRIVLGDQDAIKIRFKVKGFKPNVEFDILKQYLSEQHG
ncbi:MAG: hypothetical protein KatS3mg003_2390 [Candidatus Nitrosocaldaceae archaeon]|nr:MAG: hypothetical protein KatS3mg003_1327 [Candidatus Nitrosocaldaceae archaeon]GIU72911.1 MAG: hypothetical protein KatS3mg003_2390 [Candidatus Nitrosocaldaceae archaeon]